jgi:hypothetical protein
MQPPMGPGPHNPGSSMLPRAQVRQGTSRMVPVVVSAGLAIGVFCGLLFGLGTGKSAAEPSKASNGVKQTEEPTVDPSAIDTSHVHDKDKPATGTGSAAQASAATGSAGSAAAAGSAAPATTEARITVEIKPDSAVGLAKVSVDGEEIRGTSTTISLPAGTRRKVTVSVKATGYNTAEDSQEIDGSPASFKFDLIKTAPASTSTSTGNGNGNAGTGSKSNSGSTPRPPPPKKKPGGLIDI